MITQESRITIPELTKESRALLTKEAKKLDVQRAVTRLTRNPAAGIMARQLLYFDDKKKLCDDNWIFKGPGDWDREEGITRSQVRTANSKLVEHGLAEIDTERRNPTNNNKTTFYRLNVYRVMQLADPATLERLEPELRYLDPDFEPEAVETATDVDADDFEDIPHVEDEEHDDLDDFGDIPWCGCGECADCTPYGYERVEHGYDPLTDDDPPVVRDDPPVSQDDPPVGDFDPPYIQRTTQQEVPHTNYDSRSSVFHTGDASLSLRSPGEDQEIEDQDGTTSTPFVADPPDIEGTEDKVRTILSGTTPPVSARERYTLDGTGTPASEQLSAADE